MIDKKNLISHLQDFLKINDFVDDSKNWLQIDTTKTKINKIGYAVDAASYSFKKAAKLDIDMLFVHHWLFWGNERPITGNYFEKIKILLDNNIGLYACHLPLDAHKEVWNNIKLLNSWIESFGITDYKIEEAFEYNGKNIWYGLRYNQEISIENIEKFCNDHEIVYNFHNFWNYKKIQSVMFGSGGGGSHVEEAHQWAYDLFVTGEWAHWSFVLAKELGQSILLWWHYETETFWVKALAEYIKDKFSIEIIAI